MSSKLKRLNIRVSNKLYFINSFAYLLQVDMEVLEGEVYGNEERKTIIKSHCNGSFLCEDIMNHWRKILTVDTCYLNRIDMNRKKPDNIITFEARCPKSFNNVGTCPNKKISWYCAKCLQQVLFYYYYCTCVYMLLT